MTAPVFLAEPAVLAGLAAGQRFRLGGPEGRHAAGVRRLRPGEAVRVVDGAGVAVDGEVVGADRDGLDVTVRAVTVEPAPQPWLVVVQALPKGDRGEAAVAMLTEVGVDEVVPWAAARCVTRWRGDRVERAVERWRATAREAAKQARRSRVPLVADLAGTADVAVRLRAAALPVVLHEAADRPLAGVAAPAAGTVVVVVGPEGGIADDELAALAAPPYRLGPSVLRTSTAGVVAAGLLLAGSPRWAAGSGSGG